MYAAALTLSATTTALATGLPYLPPFSLGPIQGFGVIVAAGVLLGAALLRRYAEWHGVSDEHIRGLTGWITVTGFIGAHVFDVIAYQWHDFERDPILMLQIWKGISSYGGFLGGALGFAFYVWWKRLPVRLMADISIVGLLPAFSIGRIGCAAVSDHIGAAVSDPNAWYAFVAMDYPRDKMGTNSGILHLFQTNPNAGDSILAWNLGLVEFLYLVPVNLLVLWLAFRKARRVPGETGKHAEDTFVARVPAGFVTALTGVLYAPVRFFMDYLRPENSDPRHFGFTFAQWASIAAFGASVYLIARLLQTGKPAEPVTQTSREAQDRLKVILKEDEDDRKQPAARKAEDKAPPPKAEPKEEAVAEKQAEAAPSVARKGDDIAEPEDEDEDDEEAAAPAPVKPAAAKPRSAGQGAKKKKKR